MSEESTFEIVKILCNKYNSWEIQKIKNPFNSSIEYCIGMKSKGTPHNHTTEFFFHTDNFPNSEFTLKISPIIINTKTGKIKPSMK